jgi:2,4-dienoyl-CoA reductase-like NADH-dependent reductase (Old Yellow Enzyme family)
MNQGGDFVGVARAGIAHPNWPAYLAAGAEEPSRPPFTEEWLTEASLNTTFIAYMRRWEGFVSD